MANELAVKEVGIVSDVSADKWQMILGQSEAVVKSGICPAGYTKEKVAVIALTGREFGLGIMQSLRSLYVVNNKAAMMADMMAGLVFARLPGAKVDVVESTDKVATFEASRPGGKVARLSFTMADAVKAGLTGKDTWTKYPAQMLRARAQAAICRLVFPDVVAGLYTPEELNAPVTESGAVVVEATVIRGELAPIAEPKAKVEAPAEVKGASVHTESGAEPASDQVQPTDNERMVQITAWCLEMADGDPTQAEKILLANSAYVKKDKTTKKVIETIPGVTNPAALSIGRLKVTFERVEKAYYTFQGIKQTGVE